MNKLVTILRRQSLTFTLADGSTLRLFPQDKSVPVQEKLVSSDLLMAEKQGIIKIEDDKPLVEFIAPPKTEKKEPEIIVMESEDKEAEKAEIKEEVKATPKPRKKTNRRLDNE